MPPYSAQIELALRQYGEAHHGAGTGDVTGPGSAVSGHLAVFSGTSGKVLVDGGAVPEGSEVSVPGADTQVLFNDDGALGTDGSAFVYDKTLHQLGLFGTGADALLRVSVEGEGLATGASLYAEPTGTDAVSGLVGQGLKVEVGNANTSGASTGTISAVDADYVENWNGGHVTNVIAFNASYGASTAGGSVDNLIGFYAASNRVSGGGTATNGYGLKIENQAGIATNNWAIKTGTGLVEFGDDVLTQEIRGKTGTEMAPDGGTLFVSGGDPSGEGQWGRVVIGGIAISLDSDYLNFGVGDWGEAGFGIRNNGGTIEVKNDGGEWAAPGGAGGFPVPLAVPELGSFSPGEAGTSGTLAAGTYYIRVLARDASGGNGLPSNEIAAVIPPESDGVGSIDLTIAEPVVGAAEYLVFVATVSGGDGSDYTYVATSSFPYTLTDMPIFGFGPFPTTNGAFALYYDAVAGILHTPGVVGGLLVDGTLVFPTHADEVTAGLYNQPLSRGGVFSADPVSILRTRTTDDYNTISIGNSSAWQSVDIQAADAMEVVLDLGGDFTPSADNAIAFFGRGNTGTSAYHKGTMLFGGALTETDDDQTWFGDTVHPVFLVGEPDITVLSPLALGSGGGPTGLLTIRTNGLASSPVFTGTGLDDLTADTTAVVESSLDPIVVTIDGTGTPDTFTYSYGGVTQQASVAITGAAQTLPGARTQITFAATTGHTSGDAWSIPITAPANGLGARTSNADVSFKPDALESLVRLQVYQYFDYPQPILARDLMAVWIEGAEYDGEDAVTSHPLVGLQLDSNIVTSGSVQDNYGLKIANQAGIGTNNWAIKTGTGLVELGDDVLVHGTVTADDFIVASSRFKTDTTDAHTASLACYDTDTGTSATADIGSGVNGTVTTTVTLEGLAGNDYTIEVVEGVGNDVALDAALDGTAITVTLGTDSGGDLDPTKNTATLVAAAIDLLADVTSVASGDGTSPLTGAEGPTPFTGGAGTYVDFITLTNDATPTCQIAQPSGSKLLIILPTSDPGVAGAIWNDGGTFAVSEG